jgi:nucleoside-diphosphate-sugar epimerase
VENLSTVSGDIELMDGTVTDPAVCRAATRDVDFVLHHAAIASVAQSVAEPLVSHAVNVTGTINVLLAARDANVRRVVLAGSTAVYGDAAELPNHEELLPRPLSPYAVGKLAAEEYCKAFRATYGMETVVLRYFNIFGPRQDPASPYSAAIPKFIVAALGGNSPRIYGDGEQTRDFVFVANVVTANLLACQAPSARAAGRVFNIGTGEAVSVNELWHRVQEATGTRLTATHVDPRPGEIRHSYAAIGRAKHDLGWAPTVDFAEGLRRTVEFFRGHSHSSNAPSDPPVPAERRG